MSGRGTQNLQRAQERHLSVWEKEEQPSVICPLITKKDWKRVRTLSFMRIVKSSHAKKAYKKYGDWAEIEKKGRFLFSPYLLKKGGPRKPIGSICAVANTTVGGETAILGIGKRVDKGGIRGGGRYVDVKRHTRNGRSCQGQGGGRTSFETGQWKENTKNKKFSACESGARQAEQRRIMKRKGKGKK